MKYERLSNIIKSGNITIPLYILKDYKKFDIDLETFIFLMYLSGKGNNNIFDIKRISEEFYCDVKTIMIYLSILQDKKLIEIKVIPNDKNIIEEYINLDLFYEKMTNNLVEEINKEQEEKKEDNEDIFRTMENELGKPLSQIEVEIVKAWKETGYTDELIKEALRESVMNGVAGLRYMDKILYEWNKKGIKTKEDVEKNRREFRSKESKKKEKVDVFDYDWMDEDE